MAKSIERTKRSWDPLPNEDATKYQAFILYRDLGLKRSVVAVERMLSEIGAPLNYDTLTKWCHRFQWDERALAWEADFQNTRANQEMKETRKTVIQMADERRERSKTNLFIADQLKVKALQMLDWPLSRTVEEKTTESDDGKTVIHNRVLEPARWTVRDIAQMVKIATEIEKMIVFSDAAQDLDTSTATLTKTHDRLASFRDDLKRGIEDIGLSPPVGSLTNPIDGEAQPQG
jgi:hypothetical protein